jgi:aspartyl-tRNA(Asn)/glutamyl-tRNA(Gln) amidotransferase subunit A
MTDWTDLERRNAALNAFVDWDRSVASGEGPLASVTVGVKSNIAVAGLPWTAGMGTRRTVIAKQDAEVVRRLRGAGAVILGSLNMHEAALGATTDNGFYGRTHNPHRHGHSPGGSSGGSGAAVAAGLCDVALGTDTLGSVRIPAAYNGVYGLKPTNGLVPDDGLVMLEPAFDCIGPLARDLDLLARAFAAMAAAPTAAAPRRLVLLEGLGGVEIEPGVRGGYDRARAAIDLPVSSVSLPDDVTAIRMAGLVAAGHWLAAELGEARRTHAHLLSDELHFLLDLTTSMPLQPEVLARTRLAVRAAIGDDGVLLMPTAPQAAFAHGGRAPANQADFTCLANIAGLPALACPAGRDASGLPVSIQLVGGAGCDTELIDLARQLEPALGGAVLPQGD